LAQHMPDQGSEYVERRVGTALVPGFSLEPRSKLPVQRHVSPRKNRPSFCSPLIKYQTISLKIWWVHYLFVTLHPTKQT
jgi:hypothetical protein